MKFHWMKIISFAAIAMVRGQNNEISFFDERERERGGGRRDCPTFVENICRLRLLWIACGLPDLDCLWITLTCGLPEDLDLDCRPFFT